MYDLTAKREFFYIPDARETFIWTDVHYSPASDMLVAEGCFWACPNSVILLDFSDPMAGAEWVDVVSALPGDYDKYDALDFIRWEGGDLILKADELLETKPVELTILEEQYRAWMEES